MFAVASTFTTTDPYDANDTLSQAMAKSFYEGLFGFDKDMKMIPVLAESYDVSKDGLVYTIKLRKGVKFHDGTDFKADAVKANLDRVTNPDNKLKRYGLYNNNIAKTEVVDDYTARITLKTPFSPFIAQLAHPSTVMISPGRAASSTATRTSRSIRSAPGRSSSSSGRPPTTSRSRSSTATGARAIRRSTRSRGSPSSTTTRARR